MGEYNKDLQDYLFTLQKYKSGVLVIIISIIIISSAVAFLLPPKYKSSATILIEQQEIPPELVQTTVTSYAAQSIQVIQARVMSRTNLMKIVDKFSLYPDEIKVETTEEIVERMTNDVDLELISADVVDPRTGRPSTATIAFSLSYRGESPEKTQQVANELTSLYLNENLRNRTQKAEDTSKFFEAENVRLSKLISDQEIRLADFKNKNAELLPEVNALNLQKLDRIQEELSALASRLYALEEKKFYLGNLLLQVSPENDSNNSPKGRLEALEAALASLKAKYSDDHPDVINMKREIDSLANEVGLADSSYAIANQLSDLRSERIILLNKYSKDHPDVIKLDNKITSLEKEMSVQKTKPEDRYFEGQPDNPTYLSLQSQLAELEIEIKTNKQQRASLSEELVELESVVRKAPLVEQQYKQLVRDYEFSIREYHETKEKQMRADAAKQLESEKKGERFTLIEPAVLPEKPISPNRPAILFLGFVLSLGGGIGFAIVADFISGAVRGAKNVQALLGASPLAVIPYQVNLAEVEKRLRLRKRTVLLAILTVISAITIIHFLVSPLDVLWFRVLRKIDKLALF